MTTKRGIVNDIKSTIDVVFRILVGLSLFVLAILGC